MRGGPFDRFSRNLPEFQAAVSELTDIPKGVIYEGFVECKLEVPEHRARTVHDLCFGPKHEAIRPKTGNVGRQALVNDRAIALAIDGCPKVLNERLLFPRAGKSTFACNLIMRMIRFVSGGGFEPPTFGL
jgi:hypothetical protein